MAPDADRDAIKRVEATHSAYLDHVAQVLDARRQERVTLSAPANNFPSRLLTAREVAAKYGLTATWVREHADQLGVLRLGAGPRPRLKFDPTTVAERLASCSSSRKTPQVPVPAPLRNRGRRAKASMGRSAQLLPVSPPSRYREGAA